MTRREAMVDAAGVAGDTLCTIEQHESELTEDSRPQLLMELDRAVQALTDLAEVMEDTPHADPTQAYDAARHLAASALVFLALSGWGDKLPAPARLD